MPIELMISVTAISIVLLMALAYARHRDPLHPLMYIGAIALFLYVFLPAYLLSHVEDKLFRFFTREEMVYVQIINWAGIVCVGLGVLIGSQGVGRWDAVSTQPTVLSPGERRRLVLAGVVLGAMAVAGYLYQVVHVGGFFEAYGEAYGMGWAESGYIRETPLLAVGALLLLVAAQIGRRLSPVGVVLLLLCASPLLMHALLGARRGPLFMVAVTMFAGWYFMRVRRPRVMTTVLAGLAIGLSMLFLVANRSNIHLQTDFEFERGLDSYVFEADAGNEFIYGAGAVLHADATGGYWWGRRYAVVLFIRPIPRSLWPTKYEDAAVFLGIPNLEVNFGSGGEAFRRTLGWTGAGGAAPGIVADMWIEFWLFAFVVLFAIGWCYGRVWAAAVGQGGAWIPIYCVMLALAAFLVMQSLQAMLFRFLLIGLPLWLIWGRTRAAAEQPAGPRKERRRPDRRRFPRTRHNVVRVPSSGGPSPYL